MGQRHQFFAIARINNRYRTLAAVHYQWLYGHGAVRQCLNTMRILSATGNLQGIRRELELAESKADSFWEARPKDQGEIVSLFSAAVPFSRATSIGACSPAGTIKTSHANLDQALCCRGYGHGP